MSIKMMILLEVKSDPAGGGAALAVLGFKALLASIAQSFGIF